MPWSDRPLRSRRTSSASRWLGNRPVDARPRNSRSTSLHSSGSGRRSRRTGSDRPGWPPAHVHGPPHHADGAVYGTNGKADRLEEQGNDEPPQGQWPRRTGLRSPRVCRTSAGPGSGWCSAGPSWPALRAVPQTEPASPLVVHAGTPRSRPGSPRRRRQRTHNSRNGMALTGKQRATSYTTLRDALVAVSRMPEPHAARRAAEGATVTGEVRIGGANRCGQSFMGDLDPVVVLFAHAGTVAAAAPRALLPRTVHLATRTNPCAPLAPAAGDGR